MARSMSNSNPIAVVTGASRGAGAGIARALGANGYTVYVTGRTERPGESTLSGSIRETAEQVNAVGGRGIPVRVGVIQVHEDQDTSGAAAEMTALGAERVRVDRMREVGRGVRAGRPGTDQLCGRCADGRLAVSPNGDVWPCVFSRWLVMGNVLHWSLCDVDAAATSVRSELGAAFSRRSRISGHSDGGCTPAPCTPIIDDK